MQLAIDKIWNAPLQGLFYNRDINTVFQILKQWTAGGAAETHVDRHQGSSDGRAAYQLLL